MEIFTDGRESVRNVAYLETKRPWLSIYGTRIRPVQPVGSSSRMPADDPSLLHQSLPDELLFEIFMRMAPYSLGRASCVCRKWRCAVRSPILWRNACQKTWQDCSIEENKKIVHKLYSGSWRKMFQLRPRLRCDGLYVARNTYVRAGVTEWKLTNPLHLVCYYRYIRFYPSGNFLYKTSPLHLKDVAKSINGKPSKGDNVFGGHYTLTDDQIEAAVLYPGLHPTVLTIRLRLRGTIPGANNRLDFLDLVTSDERHNPDVPAVAHVRGMASSVFVPFEEVETSVLNLPVDKMDYFVPG